jgi:hypothetical protein
MKETYFRGHDGPIPVAGLDRRISNQKEADEPGATDSNATESEEAN